MPLLGVGRRPYLELSRAHGNARWATAAYQWPQCRPDPIDRRGIQATTRGAQHFSDLRSGRDLHASEHVMRVYPLEGAGLFRWMIGIVVSVRPEMQKEVAVARQWPWRAPQPRWSVAYLAIALAVSVLPGCERSVDGTPIGPRGPATGKAAPGQPVRDYDISKLSRLQDEFPAGFRRIRATPVTSLGPAADKFFNIGFGDVIAVDPPTCLTRLQPVRPPRGAQSMMVSGFGAGVMIVAAVKSREPLPDITAPAGCDHVALHQKKAGRQYDSTITTVRSPSIDGVTTTGLMDNSDRVGTTSYIYAASLSKHVAVVVEGLLPGNPQAEATLQEMLTKAVNAIRAD